MLKEKFKNMKIISLKDITFVSVIVTITFSAIISAFAIESPRTKEEEVTPRELAMFATIAYVDLEKITDYSITLDNDIKKLTFNEHSIVSTEQLKSIRTSATLTLGNKLNVNLDNLDSKENETAYDYLFYGLGNPEEVKDWKIVNYITIETNRLKYRNDINVPKFTAMTFKRDNNIVIAYRGTDFDCLGDWLQDTAYALGEAGQELATIQYANAIAEKYPNARIYVTGHSLGGYLAQIGGAELVKNHKDQIEEIAYFNGIGLAAFSNIKEAINEMDKYVEFKTFMEQTGIATSINKIKDLTAYERYQNGTIKILKNWYNEGNKLISYQINGDLVSALGTHCGDVKGFNASNIGINHHKSHKHLLDINTVFNGINIGADSTKVILSSLYKARIFNNDVSKYVTKYNTKGLLSFVWITHETDSFFGVLPKKERIEEQVKPDTDLENKEISNIIYTDQNEITNTTKNDSDIIKDKNEIENNKEEDVVIKETKKMPEKIKIEFSGIPSKLRITKTAKITLTINSGEYELKNSKLNTSNFRVSKNITTKLKITNVTNTGHYVDENKNNIYTYQITIKGVLVGSSKISLKSKVMSITDGTKILYNDEVVTSTIKTTLF